MGIKDQSLPPQAGRNIARGKRCIIMSMIDISRNIHQRYCTTQKNQEQLDQKPGLEARRNKPLWHHDMFYMDTVDFLFAWPCRVALDINYRNLHPGLLKRRRFAHHTNGSASRSQDMHADLSSYLARLMYRL